MADVFNSEKRSEVMRRIRSKDTLAEVIAFKYLGRQRIYFQKHYQNAPGKPDIALPRHKIAIFIDGDFWHGATLSSLKERRGGENSSDDYWVKKITSNVIRDHIQEAALLANGWIILRIWENSLKRISSRDSTLKLIADLLGHKS